MRIAAGLTLAAFAAANPLPQNFGNVIADAIAEGPPPTASVPMGEGAASETATYDPSKVIEETYASVTAQPITGKRSLEVRGWDCSDQEPGLGPMPDEDTPEAFVAYAPFAAAANAASTPAGYVNTFKNLKSSSQTYVSRRVNFELFISHHLQAYMGHDSLASYDTARCAAACTAKEGCISFNIFYERDPLQVPAAECPNPASTTVIRCVYWGAPIDEANSKQDGQWRNDFHVVIAGSNGYTNTQVDSVPGYTGTYLDKKAIKAPSDCNGRDTYITQKTFSDGAPFSAARCAAACEAETQFNIDHLNSRSICRFFNTYVLLKNGDPQGQVCNLYNQTWTPEYATEEGQWRGSDHYTISYSMSFSNNTNPGAPICSSDIDYLNSTPENQAFCSSFISYQPSTVSTSAASTVSTFTITTSTLTSTSIPVPTTTTTTVTAAPARLRVRQGEEEIIANATASIILDPLELHPPSNATATLARRALQTPASITAWPATQISAACSQVATGVTTQTVVTSTATVYTSTQTNTATTTTTAVRSTVTVTSTVAAAPSPTCVYIKEVSSGYHLWQDNIYTNFAKNTGTKSVFTVGTDGWLYYGNKPITVSSTGDTTVFSRTPAQFNIGYNVGVWKHLKYVPNTNQGGNLVFYRQGDSTALRSYYFVSNSASDRNFALFLPGSPTPNYAPVTLRAFATSCDNVD
ncbi:hypothetical protein K458DRAFT_407388 [Lentithecium fluviatile CBS 122367]|uniref:Apple domain-containing protein n=1 Tax=Lentithecium fluviatile CBS 122367 TaxID=1168545 RepID=A0A6G1IQ73_9PLEO|nr:hypothetical protein K458DRAFT_407388 [Lentithecium fluviatile CBS 122367]